MFNLVWTYLTSIHLIIFVPFLRSSSTKHDITLNIVSNLSTSKIKAIVASVPCDGEILQWNTPPFLLPLLFSSQELCHYMQEEGEAWKHSDCRVANELLHSIAKQEMWKKVHILYDDSFSSCCLQDIVKRLSIDFVASQLIHVGLDESIRSLVQYVSNTNSMNIFYVVDKELMINSILQEITSLEKLTLNNYCILNINVDSVHTFVDSLKVDLYEKYILFLMTPSNLPFNSDYFESFNLFPAIQEYKEDKIEYWMNFTIEVKDEFKCKINNSTTDIFFLTALRNSLKQIKIPFWSVTDVYNTNRINKSLDKVAEYRQNLKIYDQRLFKNIFKDFRKQNFSVVFVEANPYIKKSTDPESGKVMFSGFCYDILEDLSKALNFRYHMKNSVDSLYGNPTDDFANATGMIGMVMRGEVDLAIGPITTTAARLNVVDFLTPFQEEGIGFLMKKIDSPLLEQMFHVFRPFSVVCWVAVVVSIVLTGIILTILAKLSPSAEHKEASLSQNLWISLSSILGQEDCPRPRFLQGYIILGFWWLFITLIMALYASSLAAFLTVTLPNAPLKNLVELASQTHYKPLVLQGTNVFHLFKSAKGGFHKRIWEMMSDMPKIKVIDKAFTLVETGKYAFISDSSELRFELRNKCDELEIAQESFLLTQLSFVVHKNFPFKDAFDNQ